MSARRAEPRSVGPSGDRREASEYMTPVKKIIASLGLSVLAVVLLAGVILTAGVCVVGAFVLRVLSAATTTDAAPTADAGGAGDFDGPSWALPRHRGTLNGHGGDPARGAWTALADAEFDRLGDAPAEGPAATLICRVTLERAAWDPPLRGGDAEGHVPPDPLVVLAIAGQPERGALGPEDRYDATVVFPLAGLARGTSLTLRVSDRDLALNDPAGESTARYDGAFPLRFRGSQFSGECRGVAPERSVALAASALRAFDDRLDRLEAPADANGYGAWELEARAQRARNDLIALSDWLGWTHPELRRRVEKVAALPERHARLVADGIRARPVGASVTVASGADLRLLAWRCGDAARGRCGVGDAQHCVAEVSLGRVEGESPLTEGRPIRLLSPEWRIDVHARGADAGPRCLSFDTGGKAPGVLAGTSPTLLVVPDASDAIRVQ